MKLALFLCALAFAFLVRSQSEPTPPPEPSDCTCVLNFCKCCERISRDFPLIGNFNVNACVGVALRLDQNRMDVTFMVNDHVIVAKNFTGAKPGAPLCAPFELGITLCIELTNPSVDIIHHLFKGCPVVTGLYLDQQIFRTPLSCFAIPLSKNNVPTPTPPPYHLQKQLAAFKEFIESDNQK